MELGIWIVVAFVALVLLWFILYFIPIGLWFSALVSGVRISLIQLVLMRFRKVPPSVIVNQLIAGTKAGAAPDRERSGSALSGGRQRPQCGNGTYFGPESEHCARFPHGGRDRSGRP